MMWEFEGITQSGCLQKSCWGYVKNYMGSLGLSQKDAQSRNKWRRELRGQLANSGSPGKWLSKRSACATADATITVTDVVFDADTVGDSGGLELSVATFAPSDPVS